MKHLPSTEGTGVEVVREFSTLCKTQCCTVLLQVHHCTLSRARWIQSTSSHSSKALDIARQSSYYPKPEVYKSQMPGCQSGSFVQWFLIFMDPRYGTWFISPFQQTDLWGGSLNFRKSVDTCPKPLMLCIWVCFLHESLLVYVIALTLSSLTNSRPWVFIASVRCFCTKFSKTK
jgi:hypothetical protein